MAQIEQAEQTTQHGSHYTVATQSASEAPTTLTTTDTASLVAQARERMASPLIGWAIRPLFGHFPPLYTYLGVALSLLSWYSSWARVGPWPFTFFPLWFGLIITLDGVNVARHGSSLLTRTPGRFIVTFAFSAVFWWVFEWFNMFVHNWVYLFDASYANPVTRIAIQTIDFATVLPAFLEMAELFTGFKALRPRLAPNDLGVRAPHPLAIGLIALGVVTLIAPLLFPRYAYPLVWICLVLILDPLNNLLGRRSALGHVLAGDLRFMIALPLAAITCGFFWEMWNYYAMPKWEYDLPFLNWTPHIFEMPLPGWLGYLPFGLELFAMYQFSLWAFRQRDDKLVF